MSDLYNVVKKVINAKNLTEASDIMYGKSGIKINTKEYYQSIISTFIKRKEAIIRKENNCLIFDLNNLNDMWNIIFIAEYIKENDILLKQYKKLEEEIEEISIELSVVRNKHKNAKSSEEHANINHEFQLLNNKLKFKKDMLINYKGVIEAFYQYDWVNFENANEATLQLQEINVLKQAINIIHKFRNSIEHEKIDEESTIKINNQNFKIEIPTEYLDGFNKGRIIAHDDDEVIVERTNTITSPLLESLGYDIYSVESFFYNVETDTLSKFIDFFNYDMTKLYSLPPIAFKYPDATIKLYSCGIDLSKISDGAFRNPENAIDLYKKGFDLTILTRCAFSDPKMMIELREKNVDFTKLTDNEYLYYYLNIMHKNDPSYTKYGRRRRLKNPIGIIELYKNGIDVNLVDNYQFPQEIVRRYENGLDINVSKKKENTVFDNIESISKTGENTSNYCKDVVKLYEKGIDVTNIDSSLLEDSDSVNSIIHLYDLGIDVTKLPYEAFEYIEFVIKMNNIGIDVTRLPGYVFTSEENIDNVIKLHENGIDLMKLKRVILETPLDVENILFLHNVGIDVTKLSYFALLFSDQALDLYEKGIDITKISTNLWKKIDTNRTDSVYKNMVYLLNVVDNDYEKLNEFPSEFYSCDVSLLDEMLKKYNINIIKSIFGINNPKIIATLIYCNSVLSKYQKENNDADQINIDPIAIVHSSFNDTYKYRHNISDTDINQETYLNQFIIDENGNIRDISEIKAYMLDKFRNSCAHFRFKPVKDKDGNIMENKIYLYDKYDDSTQNNFNIIVDIIDLVEIIRQIEINLSKTIQGEENKFSNHTR